MSLRARARALFPQWSRRMRARWVVARARITEPRVPISRAWAHDPDAFAFRRQG
jgi:hypothetical protein